MRAVKGSAEPMWALTAVPTSWPHVLFRPIAVPATELEALHGPPRRRRGRAPKIDERVGPASTAKAAGKGPEELDDKVQGLKEKLFRGGKGTLIDGKAPHSTPKHAGHRHSGAKAGRGQRSHSARQSCLPRAALCNLHPWRNRSGHTTSRHLRPEPVLRQARILPARLRRCGTGLVGALAERLLYPASSFAETDGRTTSSAASKWASITTGVPAGAWRICRSAPTAASRTREARSAPENPSHLGSRPMASRSTSGPSGVLRVAARRMSALDSGGGRGTYRSLSSLPGRSMAGSMMSGLFVAPMTKTEFRFSSPSISVSIWLTTRSVACEPDSDPRFGTSASSSSKKMTHGADARPRAKSSRTARSDSPTYLLRSSGPETDMKEACDSLATAFASSVLPHPGGPYSSTPHDGFRPSDSMRPGSRTGSTMRVSSSSRKSASAPTSAQFTSGTVAKPSRLADGCTLPMPASKSDISTASGASSSGVSAPDRRSAALAAIPRDSAACRAASRLRRAASGTSVASTWKSCPKIRLTATMAASLHRAARSAPTKPLQRRATSLTSTSSAKRMPRVIT
eukprot:scaffold5305_cov107-Isochrysis_galbana.AAC.2